MGFCSFVHANMIKHKFAAHGLWMKQKMFLGRGLKLSFVGCVFAPSSGLCNIEGSFWGSQKFLFNISIYLYLV